MIILSIAVFGGCSPKLENNPEQTHSFSNWEIIKPATCTKEGLSVRRCKDCDFEEEKIISALGHLWKTETIVKEPTCTEEGEMRTDKCERCEIGGEIISIAAKGHSFGEEKVKRNATCTDAGEKYSKCTVCGTEKTKSIPALGHAYGDVLTDSNGQYRICSRCNNKDAIGDTVEYVISVTAEQDCDFEISENCQILIFRDSNIFKVLKAEPNITIVLPRDDYLVRIDNIGDKYSSEQLKMSAEKPSINIVVRVNPKYDPSIDHFVNEGEKLFDFLVKDTMKDSKDFQHLYEVAKGKKLIYIDFFYVACVPCEYLLNEHLKIYENLSQELKDDFLMIMVDTTNDTVENINAYRNRKQIPSDIITMAEGGKVFNNVPNNGSVPYGIYLDKDFNLIRKGGRYDLLNMIQKYITSENAT